MTDILMPALSPTMEEGVLAKWHVKVGDVVSAGVIQRPVPFERKGIAGARSVIVRSSASSGATTGSMRWD